MPYRFVLGVVFLLHMITAEAMDTTSLLMQLNSDLATLNQQLQVTTTQTLNKACTLCTDEKPSSAFIILSCGHEYCISCLAHMVDIAIRERNSASLRCPDCQQAFAESDIKRIVQDPVKLKSLHDIKLQEWLATQPGIKHCPTPDCSYVFCNEEQVQQTIRCPRCTREYCSNCLVSHASRLSCKEAKNKSEEEKLNIEWKRQNNIKSCPQCGIDIIKSGGCKFMKCTACRYDFCWDCLGGPFPGHMQHHCQPASLAPAQAIQQPILHEQQIIPRDMPRAVQRQLQLQNAQDRDNQQGHLPRAYITSWVQGSYGNVPGIAQGKRPLPIFVRISFGQHVTDEFAETFFQGIPRIFQIKPRRHGRHTEEFVTKVAPNVTQDQIQKLLDQANRNIAR